MQCDSGDTGSSLLSKQEKDRHGNRIASRHDPSQMLPLSISEDAWRKLRTQMDTSRIPGPLFRNISGSAAHGLAQYWIGYHVVMLVYVVQNMQGYAKKVAVLLDL